MKLTGIFASLAVASTAAAAAVPQAPANFDVTQVQSTVTRLNTVLDNLDGAVKSGTISKADLGDSNDRMNHHFQFISLKSHKLTSPRRTLRYP